MLLLSGCEGGDQNDSANAVIRAMREALVARGVCPSVDACAGRVPMTWAGTLSWSGAWRPGVSLTVGRVTDRATVAELAAAAARAAPTLAVRGPVDVTFYRDLREGGGGVLPKVAEYRFELR